MADPNTTTNNNSNKRPRSGLDVWLQSSGKQLKVGDEIRLTLVKGESIQTTHDPVDTKAPSVAFPSVLKFPTSVQQPDFTSTTWKTSRLYQQDIPKPVDDSDEEDDNNNETKKRWRYNRKHASKRQWILQEQVDFLETMLNRRGGGANKKPSAEQTQTTNNNRYEGVPEHNPSHFVLLQLQTPSNAEPHVTIRSLPTPQSTITFQQPDSRSTVTSLSQAEQAIQDQRTRVEMPHLMLRGRTSAASQTKNRLLQKLNKKTASMEAVEEGDDIMGDVAFRHRKGGGARRELLSSMGDGLMVSDDGVLGGGNDAAFGGRQRFGQFVAGEDGTKGGVGSGATTERGADGAAMQDDFYKRDVGKEYEEMDYDANEQFDDDDVDVGETEVQNLGDDRFDEDEEDDIDEVEEEEESVEGAEGLATVAGFKAMLAKARGEAPVEKTEVSEQEQKKKPPKAVQKKEAEMDHISKIMAAAEKTAQAREGDTPKTSNPATESAPSATSEVQIDENGLRLITLKAVQKEIWLNHGSIPINRLIKIFEVKKKHGADRMAKFREYVKELCTMTNHPVNGRTLVLKQHYAHSPME